MIAKKEWEDEKHSTSFATALLVEAFHRYALAADGWAEFARVPEARMPTSDIAEYEAARKVLADNGWLT